MDIMIFLHKDMGLRRICERTITSMPLQISRTSKLATAAPEPKLIPLSIVTLNKCKEYLEYLERSKKKRREPKGTSSKW